MLIRVNQRVHNAGREAEILIFLDVDQSSMSEVFTTFSKTGMIFGLRYECRKDRESGSSTWIAIDEYETILKEGIVSISEMRGELVDMDGFRIWPEAEAA